MISVVFWKKTVKLCMDKTFVFELLSLQVPLNPAYQVKEVEFTILKVQSIGPIGTIAWNWIEMFSLLTISMLYFHWLLIIYWIIQA